MKKIKIYDDRGKNDDYTCTAIYEDDFIILALIDEKEAVGCCLTEAERRIVINKENREVLFYNNYFYYMERETQ